MPRPLARPKIKLGTTFHSAYADASPKWKVVKARGKSTWDCVVTQDDPDYAGAKKVFGTEEIQGAIGVSSLFTNIKVASDQWWAAQKIGDIIHYHNGFGQFVRGVVVKGPTPKGRRSGENVMKPTALVGNWKSYDLPSRSPTGEVIYPYHASKVVNNHLESSLFQPHASNIYECPDYSQGGTNPFTLPPIDLSPPGNNPTSERLERLRNKAIELLSSTDTDTNAALTAAYRLLNKWFNTPDSYDIQDPS